MKLTKKQMHELARGVLIGYVYGTMRPVASAPIKTTRRSAKIMVEVTIPDVSRAIVEWQKHRRTML